MKTILLFILSSILFFTFSNAQVAKIETYQAGMKITYYPDSCEADFPEMEGKITFCDRGENLGVVEKSYGLSAHDVRGLAPNYQNDDLVFITPGGVSIRKTDGSWDNVPAVSAPRNTPVSNGAQMSQVMVNPDGKMLFYHGNMVGLHILDLQTKEYEILDYKYTPNGSTQFLYTLVANHDVSNDTTYVVSFTSNNNRLFAYVNDELSYLGYLEGFNNSLVKTNTFIARESKLYVGSNSGLYVTDPENLDGYQIFNTGNGLPYNTVMDMQFDSEGYLWMALAGWQVGAIVKMDVETGTVLDTLEFPRPDNPNANLRFRGIAVTDQGDIWGTVSTPSGFTKITFNEEGVAEMEFLPMSYLADQGFPGLYNPDNVEWYQDKVFLLGRSNSTSANSAYEVFINDNGTWSGISDDEPGNISVRHARRYQFSYPTEEGVWFYNRNDSGVLAFWGYDDSFTKNYGFGNVNSFLADADGIPVTATGSAVRKISPPISYDLPDTETSGIAKVRRYKDQLYAFDRTVREIFIYKNDAIIGSFPLDEDVYSTLYDFWVDNNGNPWFAHNVSGDLMLKKFDITSQTTINYPTGLGSIGAIRTGIAMPGGQMAFVGTSSLVIFDDGNIIQHTSGDIDGYWNPVGGLADQDGNLHIFTHDNVKKVKITNPLSDTPQSEVMNIEGGSGLIPYVSFYRAGGLTIDLEGNIWGMGSGRWAKIKPVNPDLPFINAGETYGITGRVYLDQNENDQYDEGEGYTNQKVSLVSGDTQFDTYTNNEGVYNFSYVGTNTDYVITISALNSFVFSNDRQRQVTVEDFESNTEVDDFMLKPVIVDALMVKSSSKEGLWGFERDGFENSFTTGIGNISFTKTYNDLDIRFAFLNDPETPETPFPDINDVKIYKITPNGMFHILPLLTIEPVSHNWTIQTNPANYNQELIELESVITETEDALYVDLTIDAFEPLHTYIIEVETGMFSPVHNGNRMSYGFTSVSSPDIASSDDVPGGGGTVILVPTGQDPRSGSPNDLSPYLDPSEVYDEPPYIDPKEIYNDGPYETEIFSSYDPNDKLVYPGLPTGINITDIDDKWLTYTVRFQNDGNFSAKDVYILDGMDPYLDLNTLTVLETSHPMEMSLLNTADSVTVKFAFNDIYLDFSENDLLASQGHVKFAIKAVDTIPEGTIVENGAAIYFDQNPPIITNRVRNQFVQLYNFGVRAMPDEGGNVNLNVAGKYQEGEQIDLKALPNEELGYEFVDWTLNESIVSNESNHSYSMPASNVTLMANFAIPAAVFTLGVNSLPEEGGDIVVKINGEEIQEPFELEDQTEAVIEAVPSENFNFIEWDMEGTIYTDNPLTITVEKDLSLTAIFDLQTGLSDNGNESLISVYPNPASSEIQIISAQSVESLQIVDMRGVVVLDQMVNGESVSIDVSGLSPGFYFLHTFNGNQPVIQKIQIKGN